MPDFDRSTAPGRLRQQLAKLRESAVSEAQANPGRSMLVAAGLGYVTGGGVVSPFTVRLLLAGLRASLRMVVAVVDAAAMLASGVLSDVAVGPEDSSEVRSGAGNGKE
jgi:hypothetical protein